MLFGPLSLSHGAFWALFLKSAIRTTIDIPRRVKRYIQQRHLIEFRSQCLKEMFIHFVARGQLAERDGFQAMVPRDHLVHESSEMLIRRLNATKRPHHQIMDTFFYRYVEHHFQMVHIGKHGQVDAEPRHDTDFVGVKLLFGVIPGANGCAELEVVEGVADGRGVVLVDEGHVLQVFRLEEAGNVGEGVLMHLHF